MRVPKTRLAVRVALLAAAFLISVPNAAYARTNPATGRPAQAGAKVSFCTLTSCYQFVNLFNRVLAVGGGHVYNGAPVVQWQNISSTDQYWTVDYWGDGTFRIRNLATDSAFNSYCLDVKDGSQWPGAQLQMWTCNLNAQQFWYWGSSPTPGYAYLINYNSNLVLAVGGGNDHIGGPVIQWTPVGSKDQYWGAQPF